MQAGVRASVSVGGHRLGYTEFGAPDAPPLLLLHGLASDSETWDRAAPALAAAGLRVIALDLPGHGRSEPASRGYLLDDFAAALDGFLDDLAIDRVALCGHSLGGAIAVHFGYHRPGRIASLVLVSAGGLGREVHPVLRAAALPGAERVFGLAMRPGLQHLYARLARSSLLGLTEDNLTNLRRARRALGDATGRAAFFASLRGVIAPSGQRGSFLEMDYLAEQVPTLLVWSEGDGVIPVAHARACCAHLPGSRLVVFPGGGHEPHRRHAQRFADEVAAFVRETVRRPRSSCPGEPSGSRRHEDHARGGVGGG